jgi:hypothetical protein
MESLIQKWVRYTVVKSVTGEGGIPENEPWTVARATSFSKTLGFRICTVKGVQDVCALPGVLKGEEIVGANCFVIMASTEYGPRPCVANAGSTRLQCKGRPA